MWLFGSRESKLVNSVTVPKGKAQVDIRMASTLWGLRSVASEKGLLRPQAAPELARIRKLIDEGVDVNATDKDGWTTLKRAAAVGRHDVVSLLVESGADIPRGSPLVAAARSDNVEVARLLIEKGATLSDREDALVAAAEEGSLETVKLLLDRGVDLRSRKNGFSSLGAAAAGMAGYRRHDDVVEYFRTLGVRQD